MIRLGVVFFSWVLWLFAASTALAQTSVVVLVPHSNEDDYTAYEHRLRSELISEGFQPVSVEVPTEVSQPMLKQHAARLMSPAAISISIRDGSIGGLVWIQSRGKGTDLLRSVPAYPVNAQAPVVFAVKAADVLHGGLLELGYIGTTPAPPASDTNASPPPVPAASPAPQGPSAPPPKPAEARPATAPKSPAPAQKPAPQPPADSPIKRSAPTDTWQFRGMFSLVEHAQRSPTSYGVTLNAMRRVHTNWSIGLGGTYLDDVRVGTTPYVGDAAVTQTFAGPRLEFCQRLSDRIRAFESLEAGAHALFVSGSADAPNQPLTRHSFTGYADLGIGAALGITDQIGIVAQTSLLVPFRPANVIVARTTVIEAAGPALQLNAGLELTF